MTQYDWAALICGCLIAWLTFDVGILRRRVSALEERLKGR